MFSPFSLPNDLSLAILCKVQFIESSKQLGHVLDVVLQHQFLNSHSGKKKKSGPVQISAGVFFVFTFE